MSKHERPFKQRNSFGLWPESRRSWSQLATKDLTTLAKTGNKETGRQSEAIDLRGCIFGAEITTAHLHISGTFPSLTEPLNASGSAISSAKSLSIQLGRRSGPRAL